MTVSVEELRRGWAAVEAGEFRANRASRRLHQSGGSWEPAEQVVAVAGATGRVGASTVALAGAEASDMKTRLVECGPLHASGLVVATTAELGLADGRWRQSRREELLIERSAGPLTSPNDVPLPTFSPCDLTVLDTSWDIAGLRASDGWLAKQLITAPLLLVTVATVPGLRALANALRLTGRPESTWCAVVGPRAKKWPDQIKQAISDPIRTALDNDRLFTVSHMPAFALTGITEEPLPAKILAECAPIFDQMLHHWKGTES